MTVNLSTCNSDYIQPVVLIYFVMDVIQKYSFFVNLLFFIKADVKAKTNTLQSYYSKELKQQSQSQKSGAGRDNIYQSK